MGGINTKVNLTLLTILTPFLIGCGGGGGSSDSNISIPTTLSAPTVAGFPTTNDTTPDITGSCTDTDVITANIGGVDILPTATCAGATYSITPTVVLSEATHAVKVKATNTAGSSSPLSLQTDITIDITAPNITITDDEPNTAYSSGGDVIFTFTFTEAVTGFTIDDIDITGGTKGAFTATSNTVYTLAITPTANSTTNITVDVGANKATDTAGNQNTVATQAVQVVDTLTKILLKTGQTTSYNQAGAVVNDDSIKDDGFYQKGTTRAYTRANDIVTDTATNLMWQDDADANTVTKQWLTDANYNTCTNDTTSPACLDTSGDTATTYCTNLALGGHNDWRLPTVEELVFLTDKGRTNPSIDPTFLNVVSSRYWSSTSFASGPDYGWHVNFYSGSDYWYAKDYSSFVRCVRDGQ